MSSVGPGDYADLTTEQPTAAPTDDAVLVGERCPILKRPDRDKEPKPFAGVAMAEALRHAAMLRSVSIYARWTHPRDRCRANAW
eukprot:10924934-Lingulodinium_polyedra.AAC.1